MSSFLIPTTDEYVEVAAKAIGRSRWSRVTRELAAKMLKDKLGIKETDVYNESIDDSVDKRFEELWAGATEYDHEKREQFRDDARKVISALNLKMLTSGG